MRALQVTGPHAMRLTDLPEPPVGPRQVRVCVDCVGVCGSDLSLIAGKLAFARYPIVPGHEFAGVVVEAGPSSAFRAGDRVTANPVVSCRECPACRRGDIHHCAGTFVLGIVRRDGAYAETVLLDDDMVRPLPPDLNMECGAMVEPLAVAERNVRRGDPHPGDAVAIFGAGNIGLLVLQVARVYGAARLMITDALDDRLARARRLGAERTVNVTREDACEVGTREFGGFDLVIDGVGTAGTVADAFRLCRPGGRVVLYGVPADAPMSLPILEAFRKDVTIHTSRLYPASFDAAFALLQGGQIDLDPVVTHRIPLRDAPAEIEALIAHRSDAVKILIEPGR